MSERSLELLKGAYDIHVHSAPSHYERRFDDIDYAAELDKYEMAGALIKTHFGSTTARTILTNNHSGCNARLFGAVTLDWAVGGLNPYAVESELLLGGSQVWMPTFHAEHHLKTLGPKPPLLAPGISVLDEAGKLRREVYEIFELVKTYNAVLATGHLSVKETVVLCNIAFEMGVKIILTHPDLKFISMPKELQIELAKKGAFIEKSWYFVASGENSADDIADKILSIDPEHCIMTTDLGQKQADPSPIGLSKFIDAMLDRGVGERTIRQMLVDNPQYLLNL